MANLVELIKFIGPRWTPRIIFWQKPHRRIQSKTQKLHNLFDKIISVLQQKILYIILNLSWSNRQKYILCQRKSGFTVGATWDFESASPSGWMSKKMESVPNVDTKYQARKRLWHRLKFISLLPKSQPHCIPITFLPPLYSSIPTKAPKVP